MYTIVSGLFDIGRGNWDNYRRPISHYLHYFKNLLKIKADIVIFCEPDFVELVQTTRKEIPFKTTVIPTTIEELYMHKHKELLFEIQQDPNYGKGHPHPVCPEIAIPMYSLVVCSKLDLLYRGTKYADTDYCIWLDAGYTHGTIDISNLNWNPTSLYEIKDKVSLISLRSMSEMKTDDPVGFSNQYIDIISGGFIAGTKESIEKVRNQYYEILEELLIKHRVKEDDQYYWTFLVHRHPQMINLIPGGWYGGFDIR